ncbi:hypothetical protein BH23GEM4_BH23GEM4_17070 [soil metagenome]
MRRPLVVLLAASLAAACGDNDSVTIVGVGDAGAPQNVAARATWKLEGFAGNDPVGAPVVEVTWELPVGWNGEPFRVYARRSGTGNYGLIATVTSCAQGLCLYSDRNVAGGTSYDYFVSTVEERGDESDSPAVAVPVPLETLPAAPPVDTAAVALDGALYLRWEDGGVGNDLSRYQVYLVDVDGEATLFRAGETDGTAYLDPRAQNGARYTYRIAAVDLDEHVGRLSAPITGVPRPDAHAELVYAQGDSTARSGFRFRTDEGEDPILSGDDANADWRLERVNGALSIVPLNGTEIAAPGVFTTGLVCGPAADASCTALEVAPASGYTTSPVPVDAEFSYAMRVTRGNETHYAVVRVTLLGDDGAGRELMIFDWAYQLRPNDLHLDSVPR